MNRNWVVKVLRERLGIEMRRIPTVPPAAPVRSELPKSTVQFQVDEEFHSIYARGVEKSASGVPNAQQRLYNLVGFLGFTAGVEGLTAECGCFRGLSAYVMNHYLRNADPQFRGHGFHIFDSFQGLSEPAPADRIDDPSIPVGGAPRKAGMFSAPLEDVRATLDEFPEIGFHPGWIPESLEEAPPGPYRLVHVDLDLHDPTKDAIEFFWPRLATGGVLVCDDYGSIRWPGARTAVEEFCSAQGVPLLSLSTGQAVLLGRSVNFPTVDATAPSEVRRKAPATR